MAVEMRDVPRRVPPRRKAVGGYRTPRRFATSRAKQVRQGLECARPLALWNDALSADGGVESFEAPPRGTKNGRGLPQSMSSWGFTIQAMDRSRQRFGVCRIETDKSS